jgi:hypothetical protein
MSAAALPARDPIAPAPTPAPAIPAPAVHLHLIVYSEATRALAGPGWNVLDNQDNPRPDWFEYWPIRRHLLQADLDDGAFYGFFSPKFSAKTQLDHAAVQRFVTEQAAQGADVLVFSPQPDMGAFFLNVFEQGETFDPGLIDAYGDFLARIGRPVPLRGLVMDARQVVFSNYFVARPAFWREWLALNEALFAACEGPASPLQQALTHRTSYPGAGGGAERKVFLQERAASLLLTTQTRWRSVPHNPFGMGWSTSRFRDHPNEAYTSDALKRAFRDTGWPHYMQAFAAVREQFLAPARRAA